MAPYLRMKTTEGCPGFRTELTATKQEWRTWKIKEDLVYCSEVPGVGIVTVEKGFVTDLTSTPRPVWLIFPPDGSYTAAAVVHDWLYAKAIVPRKVADAVFLEAMKLSGTWPGVRHSIWAAVRLFGGIFYKKPS